MAKSNQQTSNQNDNPKKKDDPNPPAGDQKGDPNPPAEPNKNQKPKKVAGLRVTTKKDGFRRGGRAWVGSTDVPADELTKEQIAAIKDEPMLSVEEIEIEA